MPIFGFDQPPTSLLEFAPWMFGLLVFLWMFFRPWWAYMHTRILPQPEIEVIDWQNYPLPAVFRERIERDGQQLQALGFVPTYAYLSHIVAGPSELVTFSYLRPNSNLSAGIAANLVGSAGGFIVTEMFTMLASRFESGGRTALQTSNQDMVIDLGLRTRDITHSFPHISKIGQLLELHEILENRHFLNTDKHANEVHTSADEFRRHIERRYQEIIEAWQTTQKIEPLPGGNGHRFRLSTMYKFLWSKGLPFGPILKWFRYQQSRRLERELLCSG